MHIDDGVVQLLPSYVTIASSLVVVLAFFLMRVVLVNCESLMLENVNVS